MADSTLDFRIKVDVASGKAAIEQFNRSMKDMGHHAEASGKMSGAAWSALGNVVKTFAIGAAGAFVGVAGASLKMAMNAVESENLFEVAMKDMAGAGRAFSEKLRSELGLNAFEVRKNTATFFQMFTAMQLGKKSAFDMATGLTKLAFDMASFFNLKPEEAFLKLQAGITGEIEPLKRLGILVDESTVKTVAYRTGIAKLGEELTQQQKVQARYVAILEQTKNAHGDLARTMDSPTNAMRILRARVDELMIKLGMALLPAFQSIVAVMGDVIKALEVGSGSFKSVASAMSFPLKAGFSMITLFSRLSESVLWFTLQVAKAQLGLAQLADLMNPFANKIGPSYQAQVDQITIALLDAQEQTEQWNIKVGQLENAMEKGWSTTNAASGAIVGLNAEVTKAIPTIEQLKEAAKRAAEAKKLWGEFIRDVTYELGQMDLAAKISKETMDAMAGVSLPKLNQNIAIAADDWRIYRDNVDLSKTSAGQLAKEMDTLGVKIPKSVDEANKAMVKFSEFWKNQVSTIVTDLGKGIADAIVAWKGFGDTLINIAKQFIASVLRMFLEGLFKPILGGIASLLGGGGFGAGFKGAGGWGNLAGFLGGAGALGGLLGGGAGAGAGIAGATFAGGAGGAAGIAAGLGGAGAGAAGAAGAGGGLFGGIGSGITGALGAIPVWGWIALAGVAAGVAFWKIFKQSVSDKAAKEGLRDFNVAIRPSDFKTFVEQLGQTEKSVKTIRKDLESSPKFLVDVLFEQAKAQGKVQEFLKALEQVKTAWGTFNFRAAFELGMTTGNWSELNKQFVEAFKHSKELVRIFGSDFINALGKFTNETKDAADATEDLNDELRSNVGVTGDVARGFRDSSEASAGFRGHLDQLNLALVTSSGATEDLNGRLKETIEISDEIRASSIAAADAIEGIGVSAGVSSRGIKTLTGEVVNFGREFRTILDDIGVTPAPVDTGDLPPWVVGDTRLPDWIIKGLRDPSGPSGIGGDGTTGPPPQGGRPGGPPQPGPSPRTGNASGLVINIDTVYGFDDFERKVSQAWSSNARRGGFSQFLKPETTL